MARVVESAIPFSRSLEQLLPVVPVSTRVQRSTNLVTEDPPFVNPQLSGRPSLDRLSFSVVPKQVEHRCRQRCRRRRRARSEDRGHLLTETLIGRSGSRLTTVAGKEATVTVAGVTRLHARRLEVGRGGTRSPLGLLDVAPVLGRSTGTGRLAGKSPPSSRPEKTQMELAWAGPLVSPPLPVTSPACAEPTPAPSRSRVAAVVPSTVLSRMCSPRGLVEFSQPSRK